MKTPYGFPIIESCLGCGFIKKEGFCDLPEGALTAFNRVRSNTTYPAGAVLFVQGQTANAGYFVCMGQVKLFSTADGGATLIHRICGPGTVVGLGETILGSSHEATAETTSPCMLNVVRRESLMKLIRADAEIACTVARHLSLQLSDACRQLQDQRFHEGALEKLACFLLVSCNGQSRVSISLTHEEIGEIIGLARETVTRTLRHLKTRNIVRVAGHLITVVDHAALKALAER